MRLLLDTQVFIWAVTGNRALRRPARLAIEESDQVFVSAASIWEIAIKARLGKIAGDVHDLVKAVKLSGFYELPVRSVHAAAVAELALHHTDPFDRLLLAQAISEPLKLLTADKALTRYTILVLLA